MLRTLTSTVFVILITSSAAFYGLLYPHQSYLRSSIFLRSKARDDDNVFKAGSHTYASWKQSEGEIEEAIEEMEVDDRIIEREPSNLLLDGIRKLYNAIFFYGLDTPTRSKRARPMKTPAKRKKKSMFFTPGEQFSQELIRDPDNFIDEEASVDRAPSLSPSSEVKRIEAEIARNLEQIGVLEVSLQLHREESGGASSDYCRNLEKRKEKLLEANERLQVELVNRLATDE